MNQHYILFALFLLLISCDGLQNGAGIIIDGNTKKPLPDVSITEIDGGIQHISDTNGLFEIHHITGFAFRIPDLHLIISKENYQSDTINIKSDEEVLIKMYKK